MPDKSEQSDSAMEPDILRHSMPPRLKFYGLVAVAVAVVVVVAGLALRFYSAGATRNWTDAQSVQDVQVIKLTGVGKGGDVILPGTLEAFTNAPLFAQVSGYIQKWYFDIGARVKKGDLLAQIDPRPYQAALDQAKGDLARDSATLANARVDLRRYQALAAQNAISQQQLATQQATVAADAGVVETDKAAVETAQINLGYTRIVAPFDGIVTSRSIDVGNLVTVGTPSSTPLFTVTDQSRLRVYVQVPQSYSSVIHPGMTVRFTVPEYPGRDFTARLVATANAVQTDTGTQLVQFMIDNHDGALKPGDYATIHLTVPPGKGTLRVPATALMFRDQGMMVATVDGSNHVVLKPVTIVTDFGNAVEVSSGLSPDDRVIDNPPDSLRAGDPVRVTVGPGSQPAAN